MPKVDAKLALLDNQLRNILKPSREDTRGADSPILETNKTDVEAKSLTPNAGEEKNISDANHPPPPLPLPLFNPADTSRLISSAPRSNIMHSSDSQPRISSPVKAFPSHIEQKMPIKIDDDAVEAKASDDMPQIYMPGTHADLDERKLNSAPQTDPAIPRTQSTSIMFAGVEEKSLTNVYAASSVYVDEVATRAAPYTIASQFIMSLISSDEDQSDHDHSDKADGKVLLNLPTSISSKALAAATLGNSATVINSEKEDVLAQTNQYMEGLQLKKQWVSEDRSGQEEMSNEDVRTPIVEDGKLEDFKFTRQHSTKPLEDLLEEQVSPDKEKNLQAGEDDERDVSKSSLRSQEQKVKEHSRASEVTKSCEDVDERSKSSEHKVPKLGHSPKKNPSSRALSSKKLKNAVCKGSVMPSLPKSPTKSSSKSSASDKSEETSEYSNAKEDLSVTRQEGKAVVIQSQSYDCISEKHNAVDIPKSKPHSILKKSGSHSDVTDITRSKMEDYKLSQSDGLQLSKKKITIAVNKKKTLLNGVDDIPKPKMGAFSPSSSFRKKENPATDRAVIDIKVEASEPMDGDGGSPEKVLEERGNADGESPRPGAGESERGDGNQDRAYSEAEKLSFTSSADVQAHLEQVAESLEKMQQKRNCKLPEFDVDLDSYRQSLSDSARPDLQSSFGREMSEREIHSLQLYSAKQLDRAKLLHASIDIGALTVDKPENLPSPRPPSTPSPKKGMLSSRFRMRRFKPVNRTSPVDPALQDPPL